GVGRDINLTENFNLEKDIPSIFLNLKTLKQFFGSSYEGVSVGNPAFKITNSMIIPETESREVFSFSGTALLELSINGLLAASFASYLGLPDLFDTQTGLTAIGRFGLMDGQAMFNYGGLFPPEPSAWEKWYLGWIKFEEYNNSQTGINVLSALASPDRKHSVIKIPINPSEYFLIENRQRDAVGNGAKVKTVINGSVVERIFPKDTTGFRYYQIDSIDGVVIDVDEFDWALPGSGILIWHIDENVIASKMHDNKINADKNNRGIDLEEADGIQDIGVEFRTIFGDVVVGDGEPVDFWFKGNTAKLYKNEFSSSSLPNSNSNSSAPSYIKLNNFSNNNNSMSFDLSIGSDEVKPVYREKISAPSKNIYLLPNAINSNRVYYANGNFFGYYDKILKQNVTITNKLISKPLSFELKKSDGTKKRQMIVLTTSDSLILLEKVGLDSLLISSKTFSSGKFGNNLLGIDPVFDYPVIPVYSPNFGFDDSDGNIYLFMFYDSTITKKINNTEPVIDMVYGRSNFVALTKTKLLIGDRSHMLSHPEPVKLGVLTDRKIIHDLMSFSNKQYYIVLYKNKSIEIFDEDGSKIKFSIESAGEVNSFTLGEIKNDGNNYIIINAKDKILAFNRSGTLANNFPIYHPNRKNFTGNIYLADMNGDSISDLLVESSDGQLLCFNPLNGKLLEEYRISLGVASNNSSALVNDNGKFYYQSISDSGYYQVYQLSNSTKKISWNGNEGDFLSRTLAQKPESELLSKDFLPKKLVYNWPNPVYDGVTNIRYFVSEDSKINIRIYDLAGSFVAELNNAAKGGLESETIWNVSNIQSGIYLARVEATSGTKTDFAIIKIAVIK
ncbi:MAG: T9SS type A sorting domain-containing protein, partial [bacterium]